MSDLRNFVEESRQEGYDDNEIADYLKKSNRFTFGKNQNIGAALDEGYGIDEILDYHEGKDETILDQIKSASVAAARSTQMGFEQLRAKFVREGDKYHPRSYLTDEQKEEIRTKYMTDPETLGGTKWLLDSVLTPEQKAKRDEDIANDAEHSELIAQSDEYKRMAEEARTRKMTNDPWSVGGAVGNIAEGSVTMAPAIAAGLITRSPVVSLSLIGTDIYGKELEQSRAMGLSETDANLRSALMTGTEGLAEITPVFALLGKLGGRGVAGRLFRATMTEAAEEAVTSYVQTGLDAGLYEEDASLKKALQKLGSMEQLEEAGYSALIGGGVGFTIGGPGAVLGAREEAKRRSQIDSLMDLQGMQEYKRVSEERNSLLKQLQNAKPEEADAIERQFLEKELEWSQLHMDTLEAQKEVMKLHGATEEQMERFNFDTARARNNLEINADRIEQAAKTQEAAQKVQQAEQQVQQDLARLQTKEEDLGALNQIASGERLEDEGIYDQLAERKLGRWTSKNKTKFVLNKAGKEYHAQLQTEVENLRGAAARTAEQAQIDAADALPAQTESATPTVESLPEDIDQLETTSRESIVQEAEEARKPFTEKRDMSPEGIARRAEWDSLNEEEKMARAYEDSDFGVKNKRAYNEDEARFPDKAKGFIDIDNLGWANDQLGQKKNQEMGDSYIRLILRAVKNEQKRRPEVSVYRYGGDEFMITAPTAEEAASFLERVDKRLRGYQPLRGTDGSTLQPTITWGIGGDRIGAMEEAGRKKKAKVDSGEAAPKGQTPTTYTPPPPSAAEEIRTDPADKPRTMKNPPPGWTSLDAAGAAQSVQNVVERMDLMGAEAIMDALDRASAEDSEAFYAWLDRATSDVVDGIRAMAERWDSLPDERKAIYEERRSMWAAIANRPELTAQDAFIIENSGHLVSGRPTRSSGHPAALIPSMTRTAKGEKAETIYDSALGQRITALLRDQMEGGNAVLPEAVVQDLSQAAALWNDILQKDLLTAADVLTDRISRYLQAESALGGPTPFSENVDGYKKVANSVWKWNPVFQKANVAGQKYENMIIGDQVEVVTPEGTVLGTVESVSDRSYVVSWGGPEVYNPDSGQMESRARFSSSIGHQVTARARGKGVAYEAQLGKWRGQARLGRRTTTLGNMYEEEVRESESIEYEGILQNAGQPFFDWIQIERKKRVSEDDMIMAERVVRGLFAGAQNMPQVRLVRNLSELPAYYMEKMAAAGDHNVRGFFDNHMVWIDVGSAMDAVANGMAPDLASAIAETALHEVVGHYGIRGYFGNSVVMEKWSNRFLQAFPERALEIAIRDGLVPDLNTEAPLVDQKRQVNQWLKTKATRSDFLRLGEELMAYAAGQRLVKEGKLNVEQRNVLQRFLDWVRNWLVDRGWARFSDFNDAQLTRIIADAQRFVENESGWSYTEAVGQPRLRTMRDADIFRSSWTDEMNATRLENGKAVPVWPEQGKVITYMVTLNRRLKERDSPITKDMDDMVGLTDFLLNLTYGDIWATLGTLDGIPDPVARSLHAALESYSLGEFFPSGAKKENWDELMARIGNQLLEPVDRNKTIIPREVLFNYLQAVAPTVRPVVVDDPTLSEEDVTPSNASSVDLYPSFVRFADYYLPAGIARGQMRMVALKQTNMDSFTGDEDHYTAESGKDIIGHVRLGEAELIEPLGFEVPEDTKGRALFLHEIQHARQNSKKGFSSVEEHEIASNAVKRAYLIGRTALESGFESYFSTKAWKDFVAENPNIARLRNRVEEARDILDREGLQIERSLERMDINDAGLAEAFRAFEVNNVVSYVISSIRLKLEQFPEDQRVDPEDPGMFIDAAKEGLEGVMPSYPARNLIDGTEDVAFSAGLNPDMFRRVMESLRSSLGVFPAFNDRPTYQIPYVQGISLPKRLVAELVRVGGQYDNEGIAEMLGGHWGLEKAIDEGLKSKKAKGSFWIEIMPDRSLTIWLTAKNKTEADNVRKSILSAMQSDKAAARIAEARRAMDARHHIDAKEAIFNDSLRSENYLITSAEDFHDNILNEFGSPVFELEGSMQVTQVVSRAVWNGSVNENYDRLFSPEGEPYWEFTKSNVEYKWDRNGPPSSAAIYTVRPRRDAEAALLRRDAGIIDEYVILVQPLDYAEGDELADLPARVAYHSTKRPGRDVYHRIYLGLLEEAQPTYIPDNYPAVRRDRYSGSLARDPALMRLTAIYDGNRPRKDFGKIKRILEGMSGPAAKVIDPYPAVKGDSSAGPLFEMVERYLQRMTSVETNLPNRDYQVSRHQLSGSQTYRALVEYAISDAVRRGYGAIVWTGGEDQGRRAGQAAPMIADHLSARTLDVDGKVVWKVTASHGHSATFTVPDAQLEQRIGKNAAKALRAKKKAEESSGREYFATELNWWEVGHKFKIAYTRPGVSPGWAMSISAGHPSRESKLSRIYMGGRFNYDTLLVRVMNKLGKPYGAKVKETVISKYPDIKEIPYQVTELIIDHVVDFGRDWHRTISEGPVEIDPRYFDGVNDVYPGLRIINSEEIDPENPGKFVVVSDNELGGVIQHSTFPRTRMLEAKRDLARVLKDFYEGVLAVKAYQFEIPPEMAEAYSKGQRSLMMRGQKTRFDQEIEQLGEKYFVPHGMRKKSLREMWQIFKEQFGSEVRMGVLDKLYGIKRALEATDESLDPYKAARLAAGVDVILERTMMGGYPEWRNNTVTHNGGEGLFQILEPVSDKLSEWGYYMAARRAKMLKAQNRENLMEDEDIEKFLQLGEKYPVFKTVAEKYQHFNKKVLDFAEQAGLIDPETRPLWEHHEYVPFYRFDDERFMGALSPAMGIANQRNPIRRLIGSEKKLGDIVTNITQNYSKMIDAAVKNHAALMAVDALKGSGVMGAPMVTRQANRVAPEMIPGSEFKRILKESGIDPKRLPASIYNSIHRMLAVKPPTGPGIFRVMRDGKAEYYQADPSDPLTDMLFRSLTLVDFKNISQLFGVKILGKTLDVGMTPLRFSKRLLTQAVTLDPGFTIRNFLRDLLSARITSGEKYEPFSQATKGFVGALTESKDMQSLMSAGAAFESGYLNYDDTQALQRTIKRTQRQAGFRGSLLTSPVKLYEAYRRATSAAENASRLAIYRAVKKRGGSDLDAAYQAKDIMDFSMSGSWAFTQFFIQTVPFLNARLQGLYRLGRGFKSNPMSVWTGGALLTFATIAHLLSYDDEEQELYDALEDWDKDAYYHFWFKDGEGDNHHYRLPKPFEIGAIFSTIPERALEWIRENEKGNYDAYRTFFGALWRMSMETFALNPTPQLLRPAIEVNVNKNWFTGNDIVTYFERESRLPQERYRYYTSATARELAELMPDAPNTWVPESLRTPLALEHLWRGYTGTLGSYVLQAGDVLTRSAMEYPQVPDLAPQDTPVLGSFYRGVKPRRTKYEQAFYDTLRQSLGLTGSISFLENQDRDERAELLEGKYGPWADVKDDYTKAREEISEINAEMREIYADPDMDPTDKRKQIDELQSEKNQIFRELYELRPGGKENPIEQALMQQDAARLLSFGDAEVIDYLSKTGRTTTATLVNSVATMNPKDRERLLR